MILVRRALPEDAAAAVTVLRRSITELCGADHRGDAETLAHWLRNKNEGDFRRWLGDPDTSLVVAEADARIVGVGCVHRGGEIRLCYVLPGAERRGAGRALLAALEETARGWGLDRVRLDASLTAHRFYERHGYVPAGAPAPGFGVTIRRPYEKRL